MDKDTKERTQEELWANNWRMWSWWGWNSPTGLACFFISGALALATLLWAVGHFLIQLHIAGIR